MYSELRILWFSDPEDYINLDDDEYFLSGDAGDWYVQKFENNLIFNIIVGELLPYIHVFKYLT